MTTTTKAHENQLRRTAARQGLRLIRSRTRNPRAADYGMYALMDQSNVLVAGEFTQDLDGIATYLDGAQA